jgi:hypothetical protein
MTFLKKGRAELVKQHGDGWRRQIVIEVTTVIGRKPGESCLLSPQDDRDSPAAAGQENGMRKPNGFLNDGQPRSLKRATPWKLREWCRFQPLSCLRATAPCRPIRPHGREPEYEGEKDM